MQKSDTRLIYRAFIRFFLLVAAVLWVPLAVILDVVVIGHGMPEHGVTEISQELLLLLTCGFFTLLAFKQPQSRGFTILVAGFFFCMLIRELDFLFDAIQHGFWKYIVSVIVLLSLLLAAIFRRSVVSPMARSTTSVAFHYMLIGLVIVLFFSRVFGTGTLWEMVLDDVSYTPLIKNTVQEGTELLGYILIAWGALHYYREQRTMKQMDQLPVMTDLDEDAVAADPGEKQ